MREFCEHICQDEVDTPFNTVMSSILLDFADEMLKETVTPEGYKKGIEMAVTAWNLAVSGEDVDTYVMKLDQELHMPQDVYQSLHMVLETLVDKKYQQYPLIDRYILDYKIIDEREGLRLEVLSTFVYGKTMPFATGNLEGIE